LHETFVYDHVFIKGLASMEERFDRHRFRRLVVADSGSLNQ
jgi:hypothetical protein